MQAIHLRELRTQLSKIAKERAAKRVTAYKDNLKKHLPSQIKLWNARENRLLTILTGSKGISITALLHRECPDPPVELDFDTDDETKEEEREHTSWCATFRAGTQKMTSSKILR